MTDLNILACRPVEWVGDVYDTVPETPIYPGSIKWTCRACGVDIWVGPKQQEYIAEEGHFAIVACFRCAVLSAPLSTRVESLGNTYKKEEP